MYENRSTARQTIKAGLGYGFWALAFTALFLFLTAPFWLGGEVVAPHRMSAEIGAPDRGSADDIENRKFSDYFNSYIPELTALHRGPRSGWLALWTNASEFGRPLYHLSGFSPAYPPMWVLGQFIDNPYRLLTILTLANCFLAGIFILLWCREVGLVPLAGFVAATILATSPLFTYWLTFPMFAAVWCWSAAIAWTLARMSRRLDGVGWFGLALATHSLLLTAYPQPVLYQAYLLGGYALYLFVQRWRRSQGRAAVSLAGAALTAVGAGAVLALPVYADLIHTASQSARLAPDVSFFTSILPGFESLAAVLQFIVLTTIPEILGNPISPAYPLPYDGLSMPLLVIMLAFVALILRFRQSWGWWLAIGVLLALTIWHGLFEFAVAHMGFNLSRSAPHGSILLPMTFICAYGADALIRRDPSQRWPIIVASACLIALALLLLASIFALARFGVLSFSAIASALIITALFASHLRRTQPAILAATAVVSAAVVTYPLTLRQVEEKIATSSPFIEALRAELSDEARYAVATPGLALLHPNSNAIFGLPSIHSYNSLSPRSYQAHIGRLGGETMTYGRLNRFIEPDYAGLPFWMSNIALVLAPHRIEQPNLSHIEQIGAVHLHRVHSRMGCCLQIDWPDGAPANGDIELTAQNLKSGWSGKAVKENDEGDRTAIRVTPRNNRSLLILSQKYHRDWQASTELHNGLADARSVRVNGFFQGVLLPPGTARVVLQFKPYARLSWAGHLFWFCATLWFVHRTWRRWAAKAPSHFKAIEA